MMKNNRILLYGLLLVLIVSCKESCFNEQKRLDQFYRFPLLKPYELYKTGENGAWTFMNGSWLDIKGISGLTVDSVFLYNKEYMFFYDSFTDGGYKGYVNKPVWVLYDIKKSKGVAFLTREGLSDTLSILGMKNIQLYDIDSIAEKFQKNGFLPPEWPACEK